MSCPVVAHHFLLWSFFKVQSSQASGELAVRTRIMIFLLNIWEVRWKEMCLIVLHDELSLFNEQLKILAFSLFFSLASEAVSLCSLTRDYGLTS
jgi:hypothetical protein